MTGSKLRVLRAVLALERFTVADVTGWTGLKGSQVIPQIARLQEDGVVEHDTDQAQNGNEPRPAHRPVRHYRVSTEAPRRQEAFDEIRVLRAAAGEDPFSQRLSIIEGRLKELKRLLSAFREKKLAIERSQQTEYEVELRSIENALDEAVLEIEEEDKEITTRVDGLRKLREQVSSILIPTSPVRVTDPVPVEVEAVPVGLKLAGGLGTELRHFFHRLSHEPGLKILPEIERLSTELKPIAGQIFELKEAVKRLGPDYNPEARIEYAVSRVAAEVVPEQDILLSATENLLKVAPEKDRSLFEYNYGNLMAWAGKDADAFKYWERSVMDVRSIEAPFRIVIGGLVDQTKVNEKVFEELASAARASRSLISIASKTAVAAIECPHSPTAALSDPFVGKIELAAKAPDTCYVVYGLLFRDVFGAQPGLSYPRLATTLVRGGADYHQAWAASERVNRGEVLVLLGHFGDSPAESDVAKVRSMLESKLSAEIIDLRPS